MKGSVVDRKSVVADPRPRGWSGREERLAPAAAPAELARPRGWSRTWQRTIVPWLFLLPLLLLNAVVVLAPSVGSALYAFTDWSGIGEANFVGLANFQRMLEDRVFYTAFVNNLKFTLIFLTVPVAMGLLGAGLLAPIKRFQLFFRAAFFIPYVLASIVNAQIWRGILHPIGGVGAWLTNSYGWEWADVRFFGNRDIVLYSIAFVDNWHWWGFLLVVYLAAMQGVDQDLYDAARVEGASGWQQFRDVTLPGIRPTLVFTLLMTIIWSMLTFDYVYILTRGGPAHASEVLSTMVYTAAFSGFEVGYAAAIALTMSFYCALVVLGFVILRRRGWEI
jgi:raffinose/stachyose/melibiose transport system permease protein